PGFRGVTSHSATYSHPPRIPRTSPGHRNRSPLHGRGAYLLRHAARENLVLDRRHRGSHRQSEHEYFFFAWDSPYRPRMRLPIANRTVVPVRTFLRLRNVGAFLHQNEASI